MALNSIVLRIDGHPRPNPRTKARAFLATDEHGQKKMRAMVYPSKTDANWRSCVTTAATLQRPVKPLEGPVRVDIVFIFSRPKNHFSSGKAGGFSRSAPIFWHTIGRGPYGGDRDNCEKSLLDVLTQSGFWTDDGLVCCGQIAKRWADLGERPGALVVITPLEDLPASGWLFDLDRKMRKLDAAAPAPKTRQVVPQNAPQPKPDPVRQFTDLWVTRWMAKHMTRYPFAGAKDALCATRIWDACGHDLAFAGKVIDSFLADDQDFYKGHTLQMLSAGGVLPKFLAEARKPEPQREISMAEMYAKERARK